MRESEKYPGCIVSGLPEFSDDIPLARLLGREITLWWSRIETLSCDIRDAMCGFRVYPIEAFQMLCKRFHIGKRMQFDTEILVKAHWLGQSIPFVPTRVKYPEAGVSHFRMFRDNVLVSIMHARLFFRMLFRSPVLISRMYTVGKEKNKS